MTAPPRAPIIVINGTLPTEKCDAGDFSYKALLVKGKKIAVKLASEGIDVIDVSGGLCGHLPSDLKEEGFFVHLAEGIKNVVKIPVIAVGGIVSMDFANRIIRDGRADLVAVGRAMLRDPDWAAKAIAQHSRQSE